MGLRPAVPGGHVVLGQVVLGDSWSEDYASGGTSHPTTQSLALAPCLVPSLAGHVFTVSETVPAGQAVRPSSEPSSSPSEVESDYLSVSPCGEAETEIIFTMDIFYFTAALPSCAVHVV